MADDDLVMKAAQADNLAQVEGWASRGDADRALLKMPSLPSAGKPSSHQWVAVAGEEVIALSTIDLTEEHVGYLNCIVKPGHGRHGIGTRMIEYTLSQPSVKQLAHLHAAIDPSNTAAQKILNRYGFSRVGYHADGRIEYARHSS